MMLLLVFCLLPLFLAQSPVEADLCPFCVQTMDQIINELLNVILDVGVIGSCEDLCNYLAKYGQVVVVACDYAGVEAFIWAIEHADLDPIWMCQEIKLCKVHDCTAPVCAKFDGPAVIQPNPGQIGGEVDFAYKFTVLDKTGAGEMLLAILCAPGSFPGILEGGELVPLGYEPGDYSVTYKAKFENDPGAEPPVIFAPGKYAAHMHLCEGQCGSKHAHTRELANRTDDFVMNQ